MRDFNQIGKELDSILRTRTTPLGLKYFEDENDLTEAFEKIEQQITICQLIGMARYHEKAVYKYPLKYNFVPLPEPALNFLAKF